MAWHPSGDVLAATSTDGRCMLFNARMQGKGALHCLACCYFHAHTGRVSCPCTCPYAILPLWGFTNRIMLIFTPSTSSAERQSLNCLAPATLQEVREGPAGALVLC